MEHMKDRDDIWPPPPTQPPPTVFQGGPGRAEGVCGGASLGLSLACLVLMVIGTVVGARTAGAGPAGRESGLMLAGTLGLAGLVAAVASVVTGLVGRRTGAGKAGLGLTLGVLLIMAGLYWLGLNTRLH